MVYVPQEQKNPAGLIQPDLNAELPAGILFSKERNDHPFGGFREPGFAGIDERHIS